MVGGYNLTDNRLAPPGIDATVSKTLDPPLFLPAAKVVCEGYVFTGVCLSTGGGVYDQGGVSVQEGSLSRGSLSEGVTVHGKGLCPGGLCLGDLCLGGLCRAARILLGCILVSLLVKDRLTNSLSMDWFQM